MSTTKTRFIFAFVLLVTCANSFQSQDKRGIGVEKPTSTTQSRAEQQAREGKPELVLQTGYNNFFGATRLVFSPDGRLIATTTFRSSTVKLWETATGRELRNFSSGKQNSMSMSPFVAFSPDSRMIAAGAGDNSVKIWDVTTGREVHTLSGAQGSMIASFGVYFIAFTGDGRVVTISDAIRVWEVSSGRILQTFATDLVNEVALLGGSGAAVNGNQLAQLVNDGSEAHIKFWDLAGARQPRSVKLSDKDVTSAELSFTPDGKGFVAALDEKRLKLWEISSSGAAKERDLGATSAEYTSLRFSRDGRRLALAENYTARIWDVLEGRELQPLKLPNTGLLDAQPPTSHAFIGMSDDGKRLASGGFDTPTALWNLETGKQLMTFSGRTNMAYKVAFSADGLFLSSGGRTRWDLRAGRGLRISENPANNMFAMPSPNGKLLAAFTPNSSAVSILETPSGRQLHSLTPPNPSGVVQRFTFSPDGTKLLITYGARDDLIQQPASVMQPRNFGSDAKIWDVKSGRELRALSLTEIPSDASFSADGRIIAVLGGMSGLSLWDAESGARLRDLSSSPMSNLAGTGGFGSVASIKSMPNMAELTAMMNNVMGAMAAGTMGRTVTSVAFSPDNRILAAGGVESKTNFDLAAMMAGATGKKKSSKNAPDPQDMMKDLKVEAVGQVVLWDVSAGREVGALKGHGKGVTQVSFNRDGRLLASGSTDNTIKIWDVAGRSELTTLVGHSANIESLDFSPNSRLLASTSDDGATFLWDTTTGEHLLTLISLDDGGEWMVVTPQGLFDGTPSSWNQILWRYNQDTFNVAPIEWFFNEFYHPGLLSDVVSGKRPRVTQDVSKKDRRQPVVKLSLAGDQVSSTATSGGNQAPSTVAARTVKLKIEVSDAPADRDNPAGSGARDLRLFRNGLLIKAWRGDVLNDRPMVALEEEVTIAAGNNQLTAYAFNKDNVKSKDAHLKVMGADSLKRAGTAYVIAVGVNEYANPQYNLKYAVADAQSFGNEVRARLSHVAPSKSIEVITLLNENATKANLLSALKKLSGSTESPTLKAGPQGFEKLKSAEPEDTVIIYFAGHGTAHGQRFYLIPHDLGYTGDRTKLSDEGLQAILSHSVSDVELEKAVEGMDAGHLLMIIDACNSGQALEAEEKRRGPMNSKGLAQLAYEKGMYILTAAQSYQAALEAAQLGHGLLTYALVEEGLKTPVADTEPRDGAVSAREWLDFATERVPQIQEDKMKQSRGVGIEIAFTEGEQNIADPQKRSLQRPRVFYRRELDANVLVIARP